MYRLTYTPTPTESELTWLDPSLAVSRPSGKASADGFAALIKALVSQPEFKSGAKILVGPTEADASALSAAEIERIVDVRMMSTGGITIPAALVVGPSSRLKYGLTRMFEANVDPRDDDTMRVFESFDERLAWWRSLDSRPASGAAAESAEAVIDPAS